MPNAAKTLSSLKPQPIRSISKDPQHDKIYGRKWKEAKKHYLAKHPLCVECQKQGLAVLATDVDHIEPHKGDYQKMWNRNNWQSLCHSCHSRKTGRERKAFNEIGYALQDIR